MIVRKLEICCYTAGSALEAERFGADRIELCDNYPEGGTTPSFASVLIAMKNLKIPMHVMVRPRGGDFLYSQLEYEIVKEDVLQLKKMDISGIVTGFLNNHGDIDAGRTSEIVDLAYPMEVTFHRAFDVCRDPLSGLEALKDTGVRRILTSGGKPKATEGIPLIKELVKMAGDKIIIMPGSGVNPQTLNEIIINTGASEYHCSARKFERSLMKYQNDDIHMGGSGIVDEYTNISVDVSMIRAMANLLRQCR